jgi:hypothetical protein
MNSSAPEDSNNGSCSEALHIGAAGQYPVEQGASGTPLTGEEHLPFSNFSLENLEGLTDKVGTLGLQVTRKNDVLLPKSRRGRPSLRRLLLGTLPGANLGPL